MTDTNNGSTASVAVAPSNVDLTKVYSISNFDNFVYFHFNRSVRRDLVKKYKDILKEGTDMGFIIASSTYFKDADGKMGFGILDGQHRIQSQRELIAEGNDPMILKVIFINIEGKTDDDIKELIQNLNKGVHWNVNDFIKSNMGSENSLEKLQNWCFNHSRLYTCPKSGKNKGIKNANMRRGAAYTIGDPSYYRAALRRDDFTITKEQWDEADTIYNEVEVLLKGMKMDSLTDNPSLEGIICGWHGAREDYNTRKKLEKLPKGIEDLPDFIDEHFDLRVTTKKDEWKNRFIGLINSAYCALV